MNEYVISLLFAIAATALLLYLNLPTLVALLPLSAPFVLYAIETAKKDRFRRAVEGELPRALMELSTRRPRTLDDVLAHLSKGYGALSDVVAPLQHMRGNRARALLRLGESISPLTERAFRSIVLGLRSGADWPELLRLTAEDIENVLSLHQMRTSALALQRYSVLLSASLFVPAILGVVHKLALTLSSSNLSLFVLPFQVASTCVLGALYLGLLEGDVRKFVVYLVIMLPLAFGIYLALSGALF